MFVLIAAFAVALFALLWRASQRPRVQRARWVAASKVAVVLGESIEGGWLQAMKGNEVGLVPETYVARLQLRPHFVLDRHVPPGEEEADADEAAYATIAVDTGDLVGVIEAPELLR